MAGRPAVGELPPHSYPLVPMVSPYNPLELLRGLRGLTCRCTAIVGWQVVYTYTIRMFRNPGKRRDHLAHLSPPPVHPDPWA